MLQFLVSSILISKTNLQLLKYETRKDEIIQTSAILFQKKGYSAVTMRDIAKAMGIKAASLYNHIKSKQEILSEIIISLAEQFTKQMKVIKNSNDSSIDKLKQIVGLYEKEKYGEVLKRTLNLKDSIPENKIKLRFDINFFTNTKYTA